MSCQARGLNTGSWWLWAYLWDVRGGGGKDNFVVRSTVNLGILIPRR